MYRSVFVAIAALGLLTAGARGPQELRAATLPTAVSATAARTDVKVWVNTKTGVYHCPGSRWYGKTKTGEYMLESQAKAKGYRPAYNHACG